MSALLKAFSPRDDKASAVAADDKPAEASQSGDGDAKKGSSSSERRSSYDRRGSSDGDRDRDRDRGDDRRKRRSRSRERRLVARAVKWATTSFTRYAARRFCKASRVCGVMCGYGWSGTEGENGGWKEVCASPLIFLRFVTVRRIRRYGCNIHVG
jgi:hypothetical protein